MGADGLEGPGGGEVGLDAEGVDVDGAEEGGGGFGVLALCGEQRAELCVALEAVVVDAGVLAEHGDGRGGLLLLHVEVGEQQVGAAGEAAVAGVDAAGGFEFGDRLVAVAGLLGHEAEVESGREVVGVGVAGEGKVGLRLVLLLVHVEGDDAENGMGAGEFGVELGRLVRRLAGFLELAPRELPGGDAAPRLGVAVVLLHLLLEGFELLGVHGRRDLDVARVLAGVGAGERVEFGQGLAGDGGEHGGRFLAFGIQLAGLAQRIGSVRFLDILADEGRLVVRHGHLVACLGAGEAGVELGEREQLLLGHGAHEQRVPSNLRRHLFVGADAFGEPAGDVVVGFLEGDYVAELVFEHGAPVEEAAAAHAAQPG